MQVVAPSSSPAQKATALGDPSRGSGGGLTLRVENAKKQSIGSSGVVRSTPMSKMGAEGGGGNGV